jgi:NAD(P)-dependent dehydrogenase (short-subunit alcohol dehydrogenase family)
VIVTGASGGIGSATARLAAQRGYAVAIHYRSNRLNADRLVEEVAASGGRAIAVRADVAVEGDVASLFATVEEVLGPVSALVNNAGISGHRAPVESLTVDNLRHVIDTNLVGCFLCCREAVRRMRVSHRGTIVNVSSTAALGGGNGIVAYAATKAGVEALTVGLAREVGPLGIRVNAVRPGVIDTPMNAFDRNPEARAQVDKTVPLGRSGSPDEVAASILWLLSDEASFVHGAVLTVSGGR